MTTINPLGYAAILRHRHFRSLWLAQVLSILSLNGTFYVQLVLIEDATQSTAHLAAMVLAFSLPGVFMSALAGVIVDRLPKKYLLVGSSSTRLATGIILIALTIVLAQKYVDPVIVLGMMYLVTFLASAAGQFFAPAEGGSIPLLVGKEGLLAANSLFTLSLIGGQVIGTVVLAPFAVKLVGITQALVLLTLMYAAATALVMSLPRDTPRVTNHLDASSTVSNAYHEIAEGWRFALSNRYIFLALMQLALVGTLVFVLASIAPGYAARVLGLAVEDAVFVFSPAGAGLFGASFLIGRFGHRARREVLMTTGLFLIGAGLLGLALIQPLSGAPAIPILRERPDLLWNVTSLTLILSFVAGLGIAAVQIPAQTVVQESSHDDIRGRVLTVQFTLINLVAIPPLLMIGNLADWFGIPAVSLGIGLAIVVFGGLNIAYITWLNRQTPRARAEIRADAPTAKSKVRAHGVSDQR